MTINKKIPFGKPWIDKEEKDAVLNVLNGDILAHGPQGKMFEEEFSNLVGDQASSVSVSSGMAALHLAYLQLGIGPGDEVLVPAMTHTATVHAVEAVGAKPVFIDCELKSGNINIDLLEKKVTSKTKSIEIVHFLGVPCPMESIMSFSRSHGLKVIEDCALGIGARYQGKHVGLFGDAGCFSFYPAKHITTGEGGMLITQYPQAAERIRKMRGFGVDKSFTERSIPGMYDVPSFGLNYRMSDINAALGRCQLKKINEILKRRKENFISLKESLKKIEDISILDNYDQKAVSGHYCLSVVLLNSLKSKRVEIISKLKDKGIGTSIYYPHPVARTQYYRKKYGYDSSQFKGAETISDQSIALPVGPHLEGNDIQWIAKKFQETTKEVIL